MTKFVTFVTLMAIGVAGLAVAPRYLLAQTVITDLGDPVGDDHGPGTYLYPTNAVFQPGVFDLTRFRVLTDGDWVIFEVEIAGPITNPWGSSDGWSLQSIDIYIDQDGFPGSGATWTLEGRNAVVAPRDAWERAVWIAPSFGGEFRNRVYVPDGTSTGVVEMAVPDPAAHRVRARFPRSLVGTPQPSWHYVVAMLSQDGYSPGRVRPVQGQVGEWQLGGGSWGAYDANILDLITSGGGSQEGMLSRYSEYRQTVPILYATENGTPPVIEPRPIPTPPEEHRAIYFLADVFDEPVASAWVRYRLNGGETRILPAPRYDLDFFYAELPGDAVVPGSLAYALFATDGFDTTSFPADPGTDLVLAIGPDVTPPEPYLAVYPPSLSPNGDGVDDQADIYVSFPERVTYELGVFNEAGAPVRTVAQGATAGDVYQHHVWNGRNDGGQIVGEGLYRVRVTARDMAGRNAVAEEPVAVEFDPGTRRLEIVLLFHFNQSLVSYSRVGDLACYRGLVDALRRHPQSHFPLHFSGSLIHSLLWFDPGTLDRVREGVTAGQFEVVGSTYIQNIMYSTRSDTLDTEQNALQIRLHRDLLEKTFGVRPVSFWNAERVWTQSFVSLLAEQGYRNVPIEDHILARANPVGSEHHLRTTSRGADTLTVFTDDGTTIGVVDQAVNTGDVQSALDYFAWVWRQDVNDNFVLTYHEDAEASGLWDFEGGADPSRNWANLEALIAALEADPRFRLVTYQEAAQAVAPAENLDFIPDGAANWMGRDQWFDHNARPELEAYRSLFDAVRDELDSVEVLAAAHGQPAAARRLLDHAWRTFAAHQYEFGVTGTTSSSEWEMIRTARVAGRAARWALEPGSGVTLEDVQGDGESEFLLRRPSDLAVLSPRGGRLLYWFDLEHGVELVGNENFMDYSESWVRDDLWIPDLRGGIDTYPWLAGNPLFPEIFQWTFPIRRRALEDFVTQGGSDWGDQRNRLAAQIIPDTTGATFVFFVDGIQLSKRVAFEGEGTVHASYQIETGLSAGDELRLRVENTFCPALPEVMDGGRSALAWWNGETTLPYVSGVTGVINTATGDRVEVSLGPHGSTTVGARQGKEAVFGLTLVENMEGQDNLYADLYLTRIHDEATPVGLLALEARSENGRILLEWQVAAEARAAGFHVWRGENEAARGRLTAAPLTGGPRFQYTDGDIRPGAHYAYWVEELNAGGASRFHGPIEASAPRPSGLALAVDPNPASGSVRVRLQLPARPSPAPYRLAVFDAQGRRVSTIAAGLWGPEPREIEVPWDGRDEAGRVTPAGIYFLRLTAGEHARSRKLIRVP